MHGPEQEGAARNDYVGSFLFWKTGTVANNSPEVMKVRLKGGVGYYKTAGGKQFIGINVGAGIKIILGIQIDFKIGLVDNGIFYFTKKILSSIVILAFLSE